MMLVHVYSSIHIRYWYAPLLFFGHKNSNCSQLVYCTYLFLFLPGSCCLRLILIRKDIKTDGWMKERDGVIPCTDQQLLVMEINDAWPVELKFADRDNDDWITVQRILFSATTNEWTDGQLLRLLGWSPSGQSCYFVKRRVEFMRN